MQRKIYYFTGTGNSMRAARIIAERLGNTEIVSMRTDPADYSAKDCGFCIPGLSLDHAGSGSFICGETGHKPESLRICCGNAEFRVWNGMRKTC